MKWNLFKSRTAEQEKRIKAYDNCLKRFIKVQENWHKNVQRKLDDYKSRYSNYVDNLYRLENEQTKQYNAITFLASTLESVAKGITEVSKVNRIYLAEHAIEEIDKIVDVNLNEEEENDD